MPLPRGRRLLRRQALFHGDFITGFRSLPLLTFRLVLRRHSMAESIEELWQVEVRRVSEGKV